MADLHLKQFEAKDFMGISGDSPIVIDFSKARKNQKVVRLSGDQGTGKTSTITALMYLMGAAFNIDAKNFKNIKDDKIDLSLDFEYEKEKYQVSASSNRIVLKKYFKEADKFISVNEPKTVLRQIFGSLGVSPMFLKEISGKKQIQYFKDTFGDDPKINEKEEKIAAQIKKIFEDRRESNRAIKTIQGSLELEPMYQNYEVSQQAFAKPISGEKEKARLEELGKKKQEYDKAKNGLDQLAANEKASKQRIVDLEQELAAEKKVLAQIQERIESGKKYIASSNGIVSEFEAANQAWLNIGETLAKQTKWRQILAQEKTLNELVEESTTADGKLDELRKELLELTQKYLPKIKGLEVKVKTGIDDEEEGVCYQGKTLAQLSESELWGLMELIWAQKDVRFVFCENVNSLGSNAIAQLNDLAKSGAVIFATEMQRSKNQMEISLETKLD